ncbi:hypothetical protein [Streptomyces sp. OE57]
MVIKKSPAAAGAAVVLGTVGNQHGVGQGPVAVTSADEKPVGNTPWT